MVAMPTSVRISREYRRWHTPPRQSSVRSAIVVLDTCKALCGHGRQDDVRAVDVLPRRARSGPENGARRWSSIGLRLEPSAVSRTGWFWEMVDDQLHSDVKVVTSLAMADWPYRSLGPL